MKMSSAASFFALFRVYFLHTYTSPFLRHVHDIYFRLQLTVSAFFVTLALVKHGQHRNASSVPKSLCGFDYPTMIVTAVI